MAEPLYAQSWYQSPTAQQLRQELLRVYAILSALQGSDTVVDLSPSDTLVLLLEPGKNYRITLREACSVTLASNIEPNTVETAYVDVVRNGFPLTFTNIDQGEEDLDFSAEAGFTENLQFRVTYDNGPFFHVLQFGRVGPTGGPGGGCTGAFSWDDGTGWDDGTCWLDN